MQRHNAVRIGAVRTGAGGQQQFRNHQVGSAHCQDQGRFPIVIESVHTGRVFFQQNLHHLTLLIPAGVVKRGISVSIRMGFCLGQRAHQLPQSGRCGIIHGHAAVIVPDGDIRLRKRNQLQGSVAFSVLRQHHQGCHPIVVGTVHIGPRVQQQRNNLEISLLRGIVQRHPAFLISQTGIRAIVQQQFHQIPGTFRTGINQRSIAGFIPLIHIHAAPL